MTRFEMSVTAVALFGLVVSQDIASLHPVDVFKPIASIAGCEPTLYRSPHIAEAIPVYPNVRGIATTYVSGAPSGRVVIVSWIIPPTA